MILFVWQISNTHVTELLSQYELNIN
jgi:hypothetical protein